VGWNWNIINYSTAVRKIEFEITYNGDLESTRSHRKRWAIRRIPYDIIAAIRRRRRRSEVTSAGQCFYARILQFQHTITNTNTNI